MNNYLCPKCNTPLKQEIFRDSYIYRCPNCNRGFYEHHLKNIQEEVGMTLHIINSFGGGEKNKDEMGENTL